MMSADKKNLNPQKSVKKEKLSRKAQKLKLKISLTS